MEALTEYDRRRYNRQMLLPTWGEPGQLRLKAASVFIAGAGGLGSPVSLYLAAAGVGELRICDADRVEVSNLNRQILHSDERIGQPKSVSAERTLRTLNPTLKIVGVGDYLDQQSLARVVGRPDIVVDCLDNFETRYLLNSYCIQHNLPLVHAAVWGLLGQATFLHPPHTPCLRCIFPTPPERGNFPVVGATPGIMGCVQAMEVLKYLTGMGASLRGRMLIFDGEEMIFQDVCLERVASCPACGTLAGP